MSRSRTARCPACREPVFPDATICPHCRGEFSKAWQMHYNPEKFKRDPERAAREMREFAVFGILGLALFWLLEANGCLL